MFYVSSVAQELSQLTNQYHDLLNHALPARERIRRIYGTHSPLMFPNLTLDFASFQGLPNSLRWVTSWFEVLDQTRRIIGQSPTLAPVADSEFVQWIWNLRDGLSPLYSYTEKGEPSHSFKVDAYSFRDHPEALGFNPKQILGYLNTLPNTAVAKSLAIAWRYFPPEYENRDIKSVINQMIGVGVDRWGQIAHEGLELLIEIMTTRPERLRRNGNSLLDIILSIASSEIPRVYGLIHPGTTRAQRALSNMRAGHVLGGRIPPNAKAVLGHLNEMQSLPTRTDIAESLQMSVPQVDTALNLLANNTASSYRTMEGFIPTDSVRSELISIVNSGGINIEELSLLSEDEIFALGLLTGTNSSNYYFTTTELDELWGSNTSSGSQFNSWFWASRLRNRIGNIHLENLDGIVSDVPVSKIERSAQRFINDFFTSGRSLISGGLYEAFIERFNRFDFELYMTVIDLLGRVLENDRPSLMIPEKLLNAPFIPDIEDINGFRRRINPRNLSDNPFSRLLRFVINSPLLIDHMSLEEKVIIGIALNGYVTSSKIPNYEEISLLSGDLGLTPKQIEGKIFKVLRLLQDGQLDDRYADTKMPFNNTPRSSLIGKINSLAPREKNNYLSQLGHDKAFIIGLLSSKRNGFYLTREDMITLWYYKYGNKTLPSEADLIRMLRIPNYQKAENPQRRAILDQLRSKLMITNESLPDEPVSSSLTFIQEQHVLKQAQTRCMLGALINEYLQRNVRNRPTPEDVSLLFQHTRIVFIEGIPIDQVTFDLLGWVLYSPNEFSDNYLEHSTGYTTKMIAARGNALNALKVVFEKMSQQQRDKIMRRVKGMLFDK